MYVDRSFGSLCQCVVVIRFRPSLLFFQQSSSESNPVSGNKSLTFIFVVVRDFHGSNTHSISVPYGPVPLDFATDRYGFSRMYFL